MPFMLPEDLFRIQYRYCLRGREKRSDGMGDVSELDREDSTTVGTSTGMICGSGSNMSKLSFSCAYVLISGFHSHQAV